MFRNFFAAIARLTHACTAFADTFEEAKEKARLGLGLEDPGLDEFMVVDAGPAKLESTANGTNRTSKRKRVKRS